MCFEADNIYSGFKLLRQENVNEIKSVVRVFEHIKSGAKLISVGNNDDNKMFAIGFRTTPYDSTGVAHILEHSVLCGSRKFKTKDPFTDIAKSSLHTFLNAMTFTDKTVYPVGSRNEKDFMNLMDLYLDAVLHPRIYENHNILKQEGWRYELGDDGNISYKGIVYSEMMGALSSPEETMANDIYKSIFPGTTYQYVSGGDPDVIPELTQENFEKFHSRFYHPSNSYIYLYGNQNLLKCLEFIDSEYLNEYDRIDVNSQIQDAPEFYDMAELKDGYSINEEDDDTNKSMFSLNFAYGNTADPLTYLTHKVLYNMLIESSASPIKLALLKAGIGESMVTIDDMNMDPTRELLMPIVVKNAAKGTAEQFRKTVLNTLTDLVEKGIDNNMLEASINSVEFGIREINSYKGLEYGLLVLESWLYDGDPMAHLKFDSTIKHIKSLAKDGYFEKFILDNMINNKHCSMVELDPVKGLQAEKEQQLSDKLRKYKDTLSSEEIEALKKDNDNLRKEQIRKDSEEDKKTIPKLPLSEAENSLEEIHQNIITHDGVDYFCHEIFTGRIEYADLMFDAGGICKEDVKYLSLLSDMLGHLGTQKRTYSNLATDISRITGGIEFNGRVFIPENTTKSYIPKFIASVKTTSDNIVKSLEILNEILTETVFDDIERIGQVIKEIKSKLQLSVVDNGQEYGMMMTGAMYSRGEAYREQLAGIPYYQFICWLDENFASCGQDTAEKLKKVYEQIINTENLLVSLVGEKEENFMTICNRKILLNGIKKNDIDHQEINFMRDEENAAVIINSNVQYVVKGYNIAELGYNYSGKMLVMSSILENDYFYPKVRLQGGAYGCYPYMDSTGNIGVFSYRDTHLARTIDVYKEAYRYLENIEMTSDELENYIIGTIGAKYKPLTPIQKGRKAIGDYICNRTMEDNQKEQDEILSVSIEDIKSYALIIKGIMDRNNCCVVGNAGKINKNADKFDSIIRL